MEIGTASAEPGTLARGWLEVADLPTGGTERLPVVIAAGDADGPTLWVTASVHGDEVTPLAVAQDLVRTVSPAEIRGTLVCVPIYNPAGLRLTTRRSYYHRDDPNRYFPALDRAGEFEDEDRTRPPRTQERIDRQVYDAIADSADAVCDLHTAGIGSMPYLIRDQVLFGTERDRTAAEDLDSAFDDLVEAIGLPVVHEFPVPEYFDRNFHRTLSGSALNTVGVPAATIELGGHTVVDGPIRELALGGLYRVLVALDMLDAVPEGVETGTTADADPIEAPVSYPVKRHDGPRVSTTGIVRHRVEAGDAVEEGDPVAEVLTPHGETEEVVESDHDGYVLARKPGVSVYANDPVCSMAVRDDSDRIVPRSE
jgi:predicted deacylase